MSMTADAPAALPIPAPLGDKVIVWSKPACVQCTATERHLNSNGIEFEHRDLTENPEVVEVLKANQIMQAPFVQFRDEFWSGFRPDLINEVAAKLAA